MSKGKMTIISKYLSEHNSTILLGLGIGIMITTTVLAVKATTKAVEKIEEKKRCKSVSDDVELTPMEIVSTTWKEYIPTVVSGAIGVACLIGVERTNAKRNAALMAAYSLSNKKLSVYKNKVLETVGEEKSKQIQDEVSKSMLAKEPSIQGVYPTSHVIDGKIRFYDIMMDRYILSNRAVILQAVSEANLWMTNNTRVSLNHLYDAMGVNTVTVGDEIGWNLDNGLIKVMFDATLDDNDIPCAAFDFETPPYAGY